MRHYFKCVLVTLLIWGIWYKALFDLGLAAGVEDAQISFARIWENFKNTSLIWDLILFLFAQMVLVAFFSYVIYVISISLQALLKVRKWLAIAVGAFFPTIVVYLLNSLFYPLSSVSFEVSRRSGEPLMLALMALALLIILLASLKKGLVRVHAIVLIFLFLVPSFFPGAEVNVSGEDQMVSDANPNIIIIGVDALRPSNLAFFGSEESYMPFLDSMLNEAEVYGPAYTPVARTHAAWVSILSGRYPLHNGARFNLVDSKYIDKKNLIHRSLKKLGYATVWGLDERRFNDIDESYGFDHVVGPKMGAADFVITKLSDIPPVNIIANTSVGKFLFPFLYINRGNYITYVPYIFNDELVSAIPPKKPVFLAAHICLPHFPFVNNLMERVHGPDGAPDSYPRYLSMLSLADKQLKNLFGLLRESGRLNNAIVYIVSDHGEGFPGVDRPLRSGNPYAEFEAEMFGHGTSVLTVSQYSVLLSKLRFRQGKVVSRARRYERLSALIDVAADINLEMGLEFDTDGVPLNKTPKDRKIFIESSFSTKAVSASRIDEIAILQQAIDAYTVNEEGQLRLQPSLYEVLNAAKQRAVISADKMVALYPDEKNSAFVLKLGDNVWWPSAAAVPLENEDWKEDLLALCQFYKGDDSFQHRKMCRRYQNGLNSEDMVQY
jgi:hypothetical protein|tara:strand:- start:1451 stop:3442 length:1992 start_codon:yes stop_codon:yes gene_type:complete